MSFKFIATAELLDKNKDKTSIRAGDTIVHDVKMGRIFIVRGPYRERLQIHSKTGYLDYLQVDGIENFFNLVSLTTGLRVVSLKEYQTESEQRYLLID